MQKAQEVINIRLAYRVEVMNDTTPLEKGLPKEERLRKRKDFDRVFQDGRAFRGGSLKAYILSNSLAYTRLGIVTSKKIGTSVVRNRIRRLLRECYRLNKTSLGLGVDLVLIPRKGFPTTLRRVEEDFKKLVGQMKGSR
ncbi:MAG TPA: ribonuclease P protein component [Candidatus Hypogeohydataceae bacterium YC38]